MHMWMSQAPSPCKHMLRSCFANRPCLVVHASTPKPSPSVQPQKSPASGTSSSSAPHPWQGETSNKPVQGTRTSSSSSKQHSQQPRPDIQPTRLHSTSTSRPQPQEAWGRAPRPWAKEDPEQDVDDENDNESVLELEGDELVIDPEEVDRLVFGNKDFSREDRGSSTIKAGSTEGHTKASGLTPRLSPLDKQRLALDSCRTALLAVTIQPALPAQFVDLVLSAAEQEYTTSESATLTLSVLRVVEVVRDLQLPVENGVLGALDRFRDALQGEVGGAGSEGLELIQVVGAVLKVPGVLRKDTTEIRQRMAELAPLLNLKQDPLPVACCDHPELLMAPIEEIRKKLLVLRNTTGLTGEGALELLTPYMFGGM